MVVPRFLCDDDSEEYLLTMYAADSNGGNLFIPIRGKSGCGKFSGVPKWRGTKRKIQGDRKVQRIGGGNALCAHSSDALCAAPHCPSFQNGFPVKNGQFMMWAGMWLLIMMGSGLRLFVWKV